MEKQAFLERFDKKTDKPLEKGFCEIDGKKYYCLTTRAGYWHAFVNCDSFSYFVFLKAIHEMAKFVGEDCVDPEFINVQIKGGYISGDIIVEDFSKGDRKVVVYSESAKDYKEEDLPGNLLYKFGMSLKEQCQQFKELARYYKNPQIYQGFLKHLLFHHF